MWRLVVHFVAQPLNSVVTMALEYRQSVDHCSAMFGMSLAQKQCGLRSISGRTKKVIDNSN